MIVYFIFAGVILCLQAATLVQGWRNLVFALRKWQPKPSPYQPRVALIAPCKGIDTAFERNVTALFALDYPDYEVFFVVESSDDPAYAALQKIIATQGADVPAHLVVAGVSDGCVQKVHNQLAVIDRLDPSFEVLACVDSDACPKPPFLRALVHPLRRQEVGAATGYRWFVPTDHHPASLLLSAINAFFASLMGPHPWNSCWGGAMALKRDTFERAELGSLWRAAFTDDYTCTIAVRRLGLEVAFVPACFVASYESMGWAGLWSFARRQFVLTRVAVPGLWWLAVTGATLFLAGFWVGLAVTWARLAAGAPDAWWAAILPGGIMLSGMLKATARQAVIRKILPEDRGRLVLPGLLDILCSPVIHLFTLACLVASGLSSTVRWRGIRYTLRGLNHVEIHRDEQLAASDSP